MDFELTDEQVELQRVVRELVERDCAPELVRRVVAGEDDGRALWKTLTGMELQGLTIPEADGGSGATMVELALTLEQLGWGADPTPFLATTTQYLPLVRAAGDKARLARVIDGTVGAAVLDGITAVRDGAGWVLHGTARHVVDGDRAEDLAVVDGDQVWFVAPDAVTVERATIIDGSLHAAHVTFDGVRVDGGHTVDPDRARHEALVGLAAVMVGASQHVFDLALAHVRQRHQFGVPIGSFQAVKHMAVDVYVAIERARALVHFAALTIAEDDPRRASAASMAKAAAGDCQRIATQHGFQMFGAMGYTWENDMQLYFRRAKVSEPLLGNSQFHRKRVAQMALSVPGGEGEA